MTHKTMRIGGRLVEVPIEHPWHCHVWGRFTGIYRGLFSSSAYVTLKDFINEKCEAIYWCFNRGIISQVNPDVYGDGFRTDVEKV